VAKLASSFCCVAWLLLGLMRGMQPGTGQPALSHSPRHFLCCWRCASPACWSYQATWQVGGFARPEFVSFMAKYNRRPDNPAKQRVRGRILDRNGRVLAEDDPDRPLRRRYPLGAATGHIVGYLDPKYGMSGVEAAEHPLPRRHHAGDARGTGTIPPQPAEPGRPARQ
jgi:hypothetical protein